MFFKKINMDVDFRIKVIDKGEDSFMNKTAKSVALLLVLAFTLSLVGCGGGAPAKPTAPQKPKELTMYIGVVEQQAVVIAK